MKKDSSGVLLENRHAYALTKKIAVILYRTFGQSEGDKEKTEKVVRRAVYDYFIVIKNISAPKRGK